MDEPEGNNHQENPDRNIEQPPAAIKRAHPAIHDTARGNDGNKKTTNWPQRIEAMCAVLLVLITGAYTYYARKQLRAMQGQITEMKNARAQSKIDNAAAIAAQQKIAQDSLITSQQNFEKSIQATTDQFHLDQRAWLGAANATYTIAESGPINSSVSVHNSGKTVAMDTICRIDGITRPKDHTLSSSDIVYAAGSPAVKEGTIFPNQQFLVKADSNAMDTRAQKIWFEKIQSGEWIQYFFGYVRYNDAFGRGHWTHFCTRYVPATKGGTQCQIYNDTEDSNKK